MLWLLRVYSGDPVAVLRDYSQEAEGGGVGCSSKGTGELWKTGSGKNKVNMRSKEPSVSCVGHRRGKVKALRIWEPRVRRRVQTGGQGKMGLFDYGGGEGSGP